MVAAGGCRATLADLDATLEDWRRYEIIDAELLISSVSSWQHQRVIMSILVLLERHVVQRDLGAVALGSLDIVLENQPDRLTTVAPDVLFFRPETLVGFDPETRFEGFRT